jgi:cephalosporin-C deacetylase
MLFDMPLEKLRTYEPPLTRQPDFAAFWERTFAEAAEIPLDPTFTRTDYPVTGFKVYEVTYSGWEGARIAGRYIKPAGDGPFPAILSVHGYSGNQLEPFALIAWASQGYAVFAPDVRGQSGESELKGTFGHGARPGFMTMGITDPDTYYYRGAYVDSVRGLDVLASRGEVDMDRVGVMGGSQGGGLTIAVCGLDPRPKACMPHVPFLCHFDRVVTLIDTHPYKEIADYLKQRPQYEEQAFRTLSYFDGMNIAPDIQAPSLFTVGLMDMICPPSSVFAAYNRVGVEKDILVNTYGGHETFAGQSAMELRWFAKHLKGEEL